MFFHNFKYNIKILSRNKSLLFWNFIFILIMGILFRMTFSNMQQSSSFQAIKVAIINDQNYKNDLYFSNAISSLEKSDTHSEKDQSPILNVTYVDDFESANSLLENKSVSGILQLEQQKPVLTFKSPGVRETILKKIVESINDKRSIYEQQLTNLETNIESAIRSKIKSGQKPNIAELQSEIGQSISQNLSHKLKDLSENTIDFHSISDKVLDYTVIEYYSLIAMACLSGAFISMFTISSMLANMSERGKRLSVSSAKKPVLILSSFLSCYLTHLVLLTAIFLFNIFILKIDYGNNLPRILLISALGSLAGISLGTSIGTLIKATAEVKTNIITFFFLFSCFLAGMMGPAIKYLVDTNLPLLNKINPANMIVDGLYSLNIYDDFSRYNSNIISLICFSFLCISLSITVLKKQKFKSL